MSSFNFNDELLYKEKYIKYKNKYLELKEQEGSGGGVGLSKYSIIFYKSNSITALDDVVKSLKSITSPKVLEAALKEKYIFGLEELNKIPNIYVYKIPNTLGTKNSITPIMTFNLNKEKDNNNYKTNINLINTNIEAYNKISIYNLKDKNNKFFINNTTFIEVTTPIKLQSIKLKPKENPVNKFINRIKENKTYNKAKTYINDKLNKEDIKKYKYPEIQTCSNLGLPNSDDDNISCICYFLINTINTLINLKETEDSKETENSKKSLQQTLNEPLTKIFTNSDMTNYKYKLDVDSYIIVNNLTHDYKKGLTFKIHNPGETILKASVESAKKPPAVVTENISEEPENKLEEP